MIALTPATGAHLTEPTTTLCGWRLWIARASWIFIASTCFVSLAVIAPKNPRSMFFDPLVEDSYQLMAPLLTFHQYLWYLNVLRLLVTGLFMVTALLIFRQKSRDWLALLTSITLICLPFLAFFGNVFYYASDLYSKNWSYLLIFAQIPVVVTCVLGTLLLLFVFPDGHFVPRKYKKHILAVFIFTLLAFITITAIPGLNELTWNFVIIGYVILLAIGLSGQAYRYYRVSTKVQQQQTKWIFYSLLSNLVWAFFISLRITESLRFKTASIYGLFELHASALIISLIPLSVAFSVFRYRLWDIDIIVRRTLLYTLLTAALSMLYLGGVAISQTLLTINREMVISGGEPARDQPPASVIVLTTLIIAILFNPLRRRFQEAIDRRFYRQKYDAEKAMGEFTTTSRSENDVQILADSMVEVVQHTLQPQAVSVWLTPSNNERAE